MFSIIIPVAKGRTAASSLHSLRDAGLTDNDDVHIIGDTHIPSLEIPRIPSAVHVHSSNDPGPNAARNYGAHLAQNPVLCFLDDDDAYLPEALHRLRNYINQHPEESVWCLDCQLLTGRRQPTRSSPITFSSLLARNLAGTCSSLVIRKEFFNQLQGFDETFPAMQDWDIWIRIAQRIDIPTLAPPYILYDNSPRPRISTNKARRLAGLRAFYEKHLNALPPLARTYHLIRRLGIQILQ